MALAQSSFQLFFSRTNSGHLTPGQRSHSGQKRFTPTQATRRLPGAGEPQGAGAFGLGGQVSNMQSLITSIVQIPQTSRLQLILFRSRSLDLGWTQRSSRIPLGVSPMKNSCFPTALRHLQPPACCRCIRRRSLSRES